MVIVIDMSALNESHLSLNGFFICHCIYSNRKDALMSFIESHDKFNMQEIEDLEKDGWIKIINKSEKITFENLQIEEKFRIFVEKKTQSVDLLKWIDEWFDLFPKGVKSGGYYVRSDLNGCKRKMKKFISTHSEYTKDIIMKATQNYIIRCEHNGYQYMKLAPYFIEKDGVSMLSGECEAIITNIDEYTNDNIKQI